MPRALELAVKQNAGAFSISEDLNDIVPAVVTLAAVDGPFGKYASKYSVRLAINNVLFWSLHTNSINSIVPDLVDSASAHVFSAV
jgi:hypothetical protein